MIQLSGPKESAPASQIVGDEPSVDRQPVEEFIEFQNTLRDITAFERRAALVRWHQQNPDPLVFLLQPTVGHTGQASWPTEQQGMIAQISDPELKRSIRLLHDVADLPAYRRRAILASNDFGDNFNSRMINEFAPSLELMKDPEIRAVAVAENGDLQGLPDSVKSAVAELRKLRDLAPRERREAMTSPGFASKRQALIDHFQTNLDTNSKSINTYEY